MIDPKLKQEVQKLKAKYDTTTWQAYSCYKTEHGLREIVSEIIANYPSVEPSVLAFELDCYGYMMKFWRIDPELEMLMEGKEPTRPRIGEYLEKVKKYAAEYAQKTENFNKNPCVENANKIFKIEITENQLNRLKQTGKLPTAHYLARLQFEKERLKMPLDIDDEIERIVDFADLENTKPSMFEEYSTRDIREKFLRFKREKILYKFESQRVMLEAHIDSMFYYRDEHTKQSNSPLNYDFIESLLKKQIENSCERRDKLNDLNAPQVIKINENLLIEQRQYLLHALVDQENWARKYIKNKMDSVK